MLFKLRTLNFHFPLLHWYTSPEYHHFPGCRVTCAPYSLTSPIPKCLLHFFSSTPYILHDIAYKQMEKSKTCFPISISFSHEVGNLTLRNECLIWIIGCLPGLICFLFSLAYFSWGGFPFILALFLCLSCYLYQFLLQTK